MTERGRRLDRSFSEIAATLEPRERAFAHELTYGVTRFRGRIDHLLAAHVHRGLDSLDPTVHELLRLGAYQLLFMGGVPAYAAVSATVDQVRASAGDRVAGFANAVLRGLEREGGGQERFPSRADDPATFLATWGSHPQWLVDRWLARWGPDAVETLVTAGNRQPSVSLCALDRSPQEAVATLSEAGIEAEVVGLGSNCVRLAKGTQPAHALAALPRAIIQDPGANLVVRYADIQSGTKVADLCAAPGGKVLAASPQAIYTLAADRSETRIRMVRENALRAGLDFGYVVADARKPPIRAMDVVMVDAPCSGTGTLARHPDARWRLDPSSVGQMAALQSEMLSAAADVVVPGGLLVYSTCTLEREENEGSVESFLSSRPDFCIEASATVPPEVLTPEGCLFVQPGATGFDGAFAARLRRAA